MLIQPKPAGKIGSLRGRFCINAADTANRDGQTTWASTPSSARVLLLFAGAGGLPILIGQGCGDHLAHAVHPDELNLPAGALGDFLKIPAVARWQNDTADCGAHCDGHLLLDAADRQDEPTQADLASHCGVATYRRPCEKQDQCGEHRDAGARPILGCGPARNMDVDVLFLEHFTVATDRKPDRGGAIEKAAQPVRRADRNGRPGRAGLRQVNASGRGWRLICTRTQDTRFISLGGMSCHCDPSFPSAASAPA